MPAFLHDAAYGVCDADAMGAEMARHLIFVPASDGRPYGGTIALCDHHYSKHLSALLAAGCMI